MMGQLMNKLAMQVVYLIFTQLQQFSNLGQATQNHPAGTWLAHELEITFPEASLEPVCIEHVLNCVQFFGDCKSVRFWDRSCGAMQLFLILLKVLPVCICFR